ncbi:DUF2124 family protein [Methanothermococcus sp.]|uniref:DUF2124 family protein n=1 Tax=Methanothermococcus sp. TaxID=2614238 RepID=UPI0025FB9788|nr:DUF2124 family protein [Methanothermococcus sp.]
MKHIERGSGVSFQLRTFRKIIKNLNAKKVVFVGSKYVCLPFAELNAYAIRDIKKQYFIPETDINSGVKLVQKSLGIQYEELENKDELYNPDVLVLLGGLAMENSGVSLNDVFGLINELKPKYIVGLYFMSIFKKVGWDKKIDFEYIIDGQINPVDVYIK